MFFATIIAAPLLAGFVAGVMTDRRSVPWMLAGSCVALGVLGAIVLGLDPDTTGRASAVAFGVIAGFVAAGLVWAGFGLARVSRRSVSRA